VQYENLNNCHVENVITTGVFNANSYGRGSLAGKNSIYGVYAGAHGNSAGYISWNGRRADVERNFITLRGGYAGASIFYPHMYSTSNPNPIFRNVKIHNCYYEAYHNNYTRLAAYNTNRFNSMIRDEDYKMAAIEMLDSRWAKQTPNRAKRLSNIIKDLAC